jgi:hypothetical protein
MMEQTRIKWIKEDVPSLKTKCEPRFLLGKNVPICRIFWSNGSKMPEQARYHKHFFNGMGFSGFGFPFVTFVVLIGFPLINL